jgi:plasmid stability protein
MKQRVIRGITRGTPRRQAQLLVRDVPLELVLKKRAAERGRSAEAEHRLILEEALGPDTSDFWEEAAVLRAETRGRKWTNSTDLIRQDRDER